MEVEFTVSVRFLLRRASVPPRTFPDLREMSWRMSGMERGWSGHVIHVLRQECRSRIEELLSSCREPQTETENYQK